MAFLRVYTWLGDYVGSCLLLFSGLVKGRAELELQDALERVPCSVKAALVCPIQQPTGSRQLHRLTEADHLD